MILYFTPACYLISFPTVTKCPGNTKTCVLLLPADLVVGLELVVANLVTTHKVQRRMVSPSEEERNTKRLCQGLHSLILCVCV